MDLYYPHTTRRAEMALLAVHTSRISKMAIGLEASKKGDVD
jgi:hypothetical protein